MQNKLSNLAFGVAQQNLSPVTLGEQQISVPDQNLLDYYHKLVIPSYEQICNLNIMNQSLKYAGDLLLPRLMNGEIAV